MKTRYTQFILAAIVGLMGMAGASAAGQGALLVCKPGAGLNIYHRATTGYLHINFVRGTRAANTHLSPGTCAWRDRAVSRREPNTTCDRVKDIHFGFKTGANRVYTMYSKHNQAPYLRKAFEGKKFSLWVRSDKGCLYALPRID